MTPTNPAESIHQRLLNKARLENRPFTEILQYYAIDRFLYRLGKSRFRNQFVLKGAFVFLAWQVPLARPTRDIDLLGFTDNSINNLIEITREICSLAVEEDALLFDSKSVTAEIIQEEANYQGVRVSFIGLLGKSRIHMRLDVGFSDVVTPPPSDMTIPPILENAEPTSLRAYPPETVIAEKFHAIITLDKANSRMKDFFDLWFMANSMEFDFILLKEAIDRTFHQRSTAIPSKTPVAFLEEFSIQKQSLWQSFLQKNLLENVPKSLNEVLTLLALFFEPIIKQINNHRLHWAPVGKWIEK